MGYFSELSKHDCVPFLPRIKTYTSTYDVHAKLKYLFTYNYIIVINHSNINNLFVQMRGEVALSQDLKPSQLQSAVRDAMKPV